MKSKRWVCAFLILFFAGTAAFMGLNYALDPLNYFTVRKHKTSYGTDSYARAIKSEYLSKHADEFDAVILGGSKAGVLNTELLSEYTGKRYYNYYFNSGNFSDYEKYLTFAIENVGISEVTLHLSSFETQYYTKEGEGNYAFEVPAILTGNPWNQLTELCNFLMTDIKTTLQETRNKQEGYYSTDDVATGERIWGQAIQSMAKDPDAFAARHVTNNFEKNLGKFFNQEASQYPAFDDNIAALKRIKALCEENGVTLKVVIGASFIGERYSYECYRYYDYLRQIVEITDVWDFSDYNDINRNPYNFINAKHYDNQVADLMVNTMYGQESREGFGIYLTAGNIDQYLDQRIADYRALKEEFETTGTVSLQGLEDDSYLPPL